MMTSALFLMFTNPWLYSMALSPGFDTIGTLMLRRARVVRKVEDGFERLTLLGPNGVDLELRRLSDLRGHCLIRTRAEALAFVRLRTSPATFNLFWEYDSEARSEWDKYVWLEPMAVENVGTKLTCGLPVPKLSSLKSQAGWYNAILCSDERGFGHPVVVERRDAFEISRLVELFLPFAPGERSRLSAQVTERVSRDGSYEVVSFVRQEYSSQTTPFGFQWERTALALGHPDRYGGGG